MGPAPSSPGATKLNHNPPPPMETTFRNIVNFCVSDWAPACERIARFLAVAIVATYAAGYAAGRILHRWNDRLAAIASGRQPQAITPRPAPVPAPLAALRHHVTGAIQRSEAVAITEIRQPQAAATIASRPATIQPPPLDTLTVAQLRSVARQRLGSAARIGGRRIAQARRADLLGALK